VVVSNHTELTSLEFSWAVAVPCAIGSRLLLNMLERYFREQRMLTEGHRQEEIDMRGSPRRAAPRGLSFATTSLSTSLSVFSFVVEESEGEL
jgi:hypothetical protein